VLRLAGLTFDSDALPAVTAAVVRATAISNPVAVVRFFHNMCSALFTGLLGSDCEHMGVLGDISNHYGVVESNGRGMLHLHALVWAKGNVDFRQDQRPSLKSQLLFASMISFLESTIVENVELMTTGIPRIPDRPQHFSTEDEFDDSFRKRLDADSNAVAAKVQIHSKHSATWTKKFLSF
jgi:Helitron helicase-like domain at N-terminus